MVIEQHYPVNSKTILTAMKEEYDNLNNDLQFAVTSKNPVDRRIPFCGMFLSIIKVLDKQGVGYENIRATCLEVAHRYVTPKNNLHRKLKLLQGRLVKSWLARLLIHQLKKRVKNKAHPDGFAVNIITRPEETYGLGYGFDIMECGICKLFSKHQSGHYTNILCEVDYLTSNLAGLELIRNGTIANGATKCDFRFKRKKS